MDNGDYSFRLKNLIDELQARWTAPGSNYFTLLGMTIAATQREIEAAYRDISGELSEERLATLADDDRARTGRLLAQQVERAFQVLSDYGKRGEYEKRGYKEFVAPDVKEDPVEFAKALYRKAVTLFNQKNFQKAIVVVEDAIRNNPAKAEYYLLLGLCQSEVPSMKRQAEQNLAKAAEIEPWNAEHVVALGMLFYSERLFKRAEGFFRKALELEPKHELAQKKLAAITGPDKGFPEQMKEKGEKFLKKVMPSFFDRKKH